MAVVLAGGADNYGAWLRLGMEDERRRRLIG